METRWKRTTLQRRGDESAATVLLVAGRSIMGLVPPFDRRDVETFEDGVPYITDLWIPADPLYTLRVQLVHECPLSFRVNPTCFPLIGSIVDQRTLIIFSILVSLIYVAVLISDRVQLFDDKLDEKSIGYFRDATSDLRNHVIAEFQLRNLTKDRPSETLKPARRARKLNTKKDIGLCL